MKQRQQKTENMTNSSEKPIIDGDRIFKATNVKIKTLHPIFLGLAQSLSSIVMLRSLLSHRFSHNKICGETARWITVGLKSSIKFLLVKRLSWSTRRICCMELPNFALKLR